MRGSFTHCEKPVAGSIGFKRQLGQLQFERVFLEWGDAYQRISISPGFEAERTAVLDLGGGACFGLIMRSFAWLLLGNILHILHFFLLWFSGKSHLAAKLLKVLLPFQRQPSFAWDEH